MSHKAILKVGWGLVGYSPRGRKESDTTEATEHAHVQAGCFDSLKSNVSQPEPHLTACLLTG